MKTTMCDGREIDISDPKPGDFTSMQIATHLSRIPRFLGATRRFYSVIEHSIVGCEWVLHRKPYGQRNQAVARAFLMHDAHEAVIGDIVSPLVRQTPGLAELLDPVKSRIDAAIEEAFSVRLSDKAIARRVKQVDYLMLQTEWIALMPTPWGEPAHSIDGLMPPVIYAHHPPETIGQMIGHFQHLLRVTE